MTADAKIFRVHAPRAVLFAPNQAGATAEPRCHCTGHRAPVCPDCCHTECALVSLILIDMSNGRGTTLQPPLKLLQTLPGADLEISEGGFKGSKLIDDSAMLDKWCRDHEAGRRVMSD